MEINKNIYSDFIKDIKIEKIYLKYIQANKEDFDLNAFALKPNSKIDVFVGYSSDKESKTNDKLLVSTLFKVEAKYEDNTIFDINIKYILEYVLNNKSFDNIEDDIINFFIEKNVPVNIWPYAREFISSLTSRMDYPAFIMEPYLG